MDHIALSQCFDKHSFNELNSIDDSMIFKSLCKAQTIFTDLFNNGVFFDVGCNAGSFIKVLQAFNIKNNIHCFEPHPYLVDKVVSVYPYVIMNNICISNKIEKSVIYIPSLSCGISSLIKRPVFETLIADGQTIIEYPIDTLTIDEYVKLNNIGNINFIKIDVEGAEKLVFEGAQNSLKTGIIKSGIFEIGQTLIDAGTTADEVCNYLNFYGYNIDKTIGPNDYFFYRID